MTRRKELERTVSKGVAEDYVDNGSSSHRQLYDGSMLDNAKTLMHAMRGYYGKQLHDPITLVMLLHLILTLLHFIVWASTYGGVNGNGPSNVSNFSAFVFPRTILAWVGLGDGHGSGWGGDTILVIILNALVFIP